MLSRGPDVTEMLGDRVALCGTTLRLRGELHLNGHEIQELVRGRFFSHAQVAELVTEVLPTLRERIQALGILPSRRVVFDAWA